MTNNDDIKYGLDLSSLIDEAYNDAPRLSQVELRAVILSETFLGYVNHAQLDWQTALEYSFRNRLSTAPTMFYKALIYHTSVEDGMRSWARQALSAEYALQKLYDMDPGHVRESFLRNVMYEVLKSKSGFFAGGHRGQPKRWDEGIYRYVEMFNNNSWCGMTKARAFEMARGVMGEILEETELGRKPYNVKEISYWGYDIP